MSTPLPEGQWVWRRVAIFTVCSFLMWKLHGLIDRMPLGDLRPITQHLILLLATLLALYLIGPTAEHIIALVRAWRGDNSK